MLDCNALRGSGQTFIQSSAGGALVFMDAYGADRSRTLEPSVHDGGYYMVSGRVLGCQRVTSLD